MKNNKRICKDCGAIFKNVDNRCVVCDKKNIIDTNTPVGKKLIQEIHNGKDEITAEYKITLTSFSNLTSSIIKAFFSLIFLFLVGSCYFENFKEVFKKDKTEIEKIVFKNGYTQFYVDGYFPACYKAQYVIDFVEKVKNPNLTDKEIFEEFIINEKCFLAEPKNRSITFVKKENGLVMVDIKARLGDKRAYTTVPIFEEFIKK